MALNQGCHRATVREPCQGKYREKQRAVTWTILILFEVQDSFRLIIYICIQDTRFRKIIDMCNYIEGSFMLCVWDETMNRAAQTLVTQDTE